eukprot:CAMPEP_0198203428 /NCGR_PEP_ID=MMETSP1445-20131203/6719_1 /TAXON_ID=36898 /ORGANISM="Pyramimonas sp., Strain CCMP2087" /LENGTH=148 /DNA_ID=CAMNT_0043874825 /DNA_START=209 /DNA_END=655 /DNA_ORIENTATION=-
MSAVQMVEESRERSQLYSEWTTHRSTDDNLWEEGSSRGRTTVDQRLIDSFRRLGSNDSLISTCSSSSIDSFTSSDAAETSGTLHSDDDARWLKWLRKRRSKPIPSKLSAIQLVQQNNRELSQIHSEWMTQRRTQGMGDISDITFASTD